MAGPNVISEFERNQRLRDINRRLREINSERAAISEKWRGAPPLDESNTLAALDEETTMLRAERAEIQEPEFTPEMARQYVSRLWSQVNDLVKLMRRISRWLIGLTVWAIAMTLALWWFGMQVWRITELWR